jgi:ABC-type antimicrobial peptide transport system permease subunit
MALGAQRPQVVWLVMRDVTMLIGVSIAIGSALSLAAMALVKSLAQSPAGPVDVPGTDPVTLLAVVAVMAATALAAAYFPARRAANADPSLSLRHQ